MRDLARVFGALSDPTRLEMLVLLLRRGELCVCDFVGTLEIGQSKASRHLRYLLNAGLLVDRREGQWAHYRVAPELGGDARTILGALEKVFSRRDVGPLERRLGQWLRRRKTSLGACRAVGRRAAGA